MTRSRFSCVDRVLELVAERRLHYQRRLEASRGATSLRSLAEAIATARGNAVTDDEFVVAVSEAVACGAAVTRLARPLFQDQRVSTWLRNQANPLWQEIIEEAFALGLGRELGDWETESADEDPILAFYEVFLQRHDRGRRIRHGVFYTPPPIARYILAQVHRCLIDEFGLSDGLADTATWEEMIQRVPSLSLPAGATLGLPFVRLLDPALGAGVFFSEGIKLVHKHLAAKWSAAGVSACAAADRWNQYVAACLLPRWSGLELMLPACVVATFKLAVTLAQTGFSFTLPSRLGIHLGNTLAGPMERPCSLFPASENAWLPAAVANRDLVYQTPFTVIVGNPPFSGISAQQGRWIVNLLRGSEAGRSNWSNYFAVDGQPLRERKTWLQDDYVKFLRFAHWKIETAGCGLVALVTNHGYLDNSTFRGLRAALRDTFSRITVVDLHGNRKKRERAPDGQTDENVFAIEQGTAIGLFRRAAAGSTSAAVWHGELWGAAKEKLRTLDEAAERLAREGGPCAVALQQIVSEAGQYFFVPRPLVAFEEYTAAPSLPGLMPVNVTAPVTARDHFVVALTSEELLERMAEFRDLAIADDDIRRRYFTRTRSAKYAAGDTRGWKLPIARRRLAADPHWREHLRTCWYRPFDERFVYWTEGMIDWPRSELTRCLVHPGNVALVARRQMLPTQPCNYFWITDQLLLDGLIRSDNRGSESAFPLFLEPPRDAETRSNCFNLDEHLLEQAAQRLGVRWQPDGLDGGETLTAGDWLYYTYALFFSPTYRLRYADRLWSDFPRVLLARRLPMFRKLAEFGRRLAGWHLLRRLRSPASETNSANLANDVAEHLVWSGDAAWNVLRGFPKFDARRIWINPKTWLEPVPREVWQFQAGGYQVCSKWLKDRCGRTLNDRDLAIYRGIVSAIAGTLRTMDEIDVEIEAAGGWPAAFTRFDV